MPLATFLERPLRIAGELARGQLGGSYAEAGIIISSAISSVASLVWPGEGIDRVRFVEAWVRFADPALHASRVSVPLLLRHAEDETTNLVTWRRHAASLMRMRAGVYGPGYDVTVITADEADADEAAVLAACAGIDLAVVRRHTYPAIFYAVVRSALVHEYQLRMHGRAAAWPMSNDPDAGVSYVNMMGPDESDLRVLRQIHFHIPWLIEVARSMGRSVDAQLGATNYQPLPQPPLWWARAT